MSLRCEVVRGLSTWIKLKIKGVVKDIRNACFFQVGSNYFLEINSKAL